MNLGDWKYYNHAVLPTVEPHEVPDISCIKDRSIWKIGGGILIYRFSYDGQQTMIAIIKRHGGML